LVAGVQDVFETEENLVAVACNHPNLSYKSECQNENSAILKTTSATTSKSECSAQQRSPHELKVGSAIFLIISGITKRRVV
jgi:hypothetical protein